MHTQKTNGFTLIEVTLAIAIVSFAFLSVFGMIPTGLGTFRQAMDVSVGSHIAQRVLNDLQQTDFASITSGASTQPDTTLRYEWTLPDKTQSTIRYFDVQGGEVSEPSEAIYQVNTRVMPSTIMPHSGTAPVEATNANLATITVQVARNPSAQPLAFSSAGADDASEPMRNLWTGAYQNEPSKTGVVPIATYSIRISCSQ